MKKLILAITATVGFLLSPTTASAQSSLYAEVGGWAIFQNSKSCHMSAEYESDTLLTVYMEDSEHAAFWLQNPAWKSIKQDARYSLKIEFDDYGAWDMPSTGRSDDDGPGVAWVGNIDQNADGDTFMGEFMIASGMRVSINGREVGRYSMKDTRSAALSLSRCVIQAQKGRDPFRGQGQVDPFNGI